MKRWKRPALGAAVTIVAWSCAMPVGDAPRPEQDGYALTAEDHGLDLMLPFPAGERRQLTRAYMGAPEQCAPPPGQPRQTSHCRYGPGLWDDRYALDFSDAGCGSWRAPVLAAASGIVTIPDDPTGSRARSYGEAELALDHGNGCQSHYGHLDERVVHDGQAVFQGQVIGYEGNRGNVVGGACPAHPGTHLHFKVVCNGEAVKPEPLSGYRDLGALAHHWFEHRALHHPVGTLVKALGDPRIHVVCAPDRLCHVADESVWRSRRYWQDSHDEWATVLTVDPDEIACHAVGLPITTTARLAATVCGGSTYVTFDGDGTRWRKLVPFDPSREEYRILLRSWGFRPDEVARNDTSCSFPYDAVRDRLSLRDGTVIEQASESDFYVVSDEGTAYRLYRNLMPVLYGSGWPQVIQVPDGSVPSLVRTVNHAHAEFTVTDATTCPNGRMTLAPSEGGASGGGTEPVSDSYPQDTPSAPDTTPAPIDATPAPEPGSTPADLVAHCGPAEPPVPPAPDPAPIPQPGGPPRSVVCARDGQSVVVTISGPVSDALVGDAPAQPIAIKYGSDRDGWTDFGYGAGSAKDQQPWRGEGTYVLTLPTDAGRFNFYLLGSDGSVGWFDLPDADGDGVAWTVQGDCRIVCAPDSCALSF